MPVVTMYSRAACGLCDQAREAILSLRGRIAFGYEEVLVDDDPQLERAYGLRIPVVMVDGEERFEGAVDAEALWEELAGA